MSLTPISWLGRAPDYLHHPSGAETFDVHAAARYYDSRSADEGRAHEVRQRERETERARERVCVGVEEIESV